MSLSQSTNDSNIQDPLRPKKIQYQAAPYLIAAQHGFESLGDSNTDHESLEKVAHDRFLNHKDKIGNISSSIINQVESISNTNDHSNDDGSANLNPTRDQDDFVLKGEGDLTFDLSGSMDSIYTDHFRGGNGNILDEDSFFTKSLQSMSLGTCTTTSEVGLNLGTSGINITSNVNINMGQITPTKTIFTTTYTTPVTTTITTTNSNNISGSMSNLQSVYSNSPLKESYYPSPASSSTSMSNDLERYEVLQTIGKGAFASVRLVRYVETNQILAMKILRKADIIKTKQVRHAKR